MTALVALAVLFLGAALVVLLAALKAGSDADDRAGRE